MSRHPSGRWSQVSVCPRARCSHTGVFCEGVPWELLCPAPEQPSPHAGLLCLCIRHQWLLLAVDFWTKRQSPQKHREHVVAHCVAGGSSWCPCGSGFAVSCSVVPSTNSTGSREGAECFSEQKVLQARRGLQRALPLNSCVKAVLFFRCHSTFSGGRRPRGSGWCGTARGDPRRNHR